MASSFVLGERYERLISNLISSGEYNNRSEVVRDALRQLERQRQRMTLEDLDMMHQEGVKSGQAIPANQVFAELRKIVDNVRSSSERASVKTPGVTRRK